MTLENSQFDYPMVINSRVLYWIDYFTGKGRGHFARYLERSELFIPFIQPILRQNGMPEDLVYLAMIESGFNNHARSHAKAVGPWQFISATGKRYGLMVNWWVDERRDTRKSTLSAIQYLKDLNTFFQSWELAAAAYNAGEAKIARAVRRFGTKDFWVLSQHRFLRQETRDYVPKIMAAAIVAKNRTQFGFPSSRLAPGSGEVVSGDGEVVRLESESAEDSKAALADRKQAVAPGEPGEDSIESVLREAGATYGNEYEEKPEYLVDAKTLGNPELSEKPRETPPLAKVIATPAVTKKGEIFGEQLQEFEVQSPADLLKVSRAAGLSYSTVKALNPELLRWCTPPTVSTYRVKLPSSAREKFLTAYNAADFQRRVQFLTYRVRSGETIANVARHFGVKPEPLADLNGISQSMRLRAGVRVLLPMPDDRSRSLASLEVRDPPELRRSRRKKSYSKISYRKREAARRPRSSGG